MFFRFVNSYLSLALAIGMVFYMSDHMAYAEENLPEVTVQLLKTGLSKTETIELTLEDALKMAESENLNLKTAQDDVNEAKAKYYTKLSEMLPDIELNLENSSYEGSIQTATSQVIAANQNVTTQPFTLEVLSIDRKTIQPQLVFRFPFFQGGRRFFQAKAAKKNLDAEHENAKTTHQQVLRKTALAYYELKRRLNEVVIAQKQFEETKANLELNLARMDAGAGTRLDVLQSEAQVANAHQQILEATKYSEIAALNLNEILNIPAFSSILPGENTQQMQTLVPMEVDLSILMDVAYKNRPELKALTKGTESLRELRKVVYSAVLPEANLEIRTGSVGSDLNQLGHFDEVTLTVGLKFRNLLTSALTRYKENTAQMEKLQHQLQAVEKSIERELSEAYLQAKTRQAQVSVVKAELAASEQALGDAIERLKVGIGRNIDLLDAETNLMRARTNLSSTIFEYNQAQVDLVYALGLASVESLTKGIYLP